MLMSTHNSVVQSKAFNLTNDREFDNSSACTLVLSHGVTMHISCPHTSPQNDRVQSAWAFR
jgi:hypothetical protein